MGIARAQIYKVVASFFSVSQKVTYWVLEKDSYYVIYTMYVHIIQYTVYIFRPLFFLIRFYFYFYAGW